MSQISMLSNEEKFIKWLSSIVSPSKVNDYYLACKQIEEFCLNKKIINYPLLETTDIKIVLKVKEIVERNKVFKFYHKKNKNELMSAIGFFYTYIKTQNDALKSELKSEVLSKDTSIRTTDMDEKNNINNFDTPKAILNGDELKEVNFRNPGTYAYTKPIKYMYFEEEFCDFNSWKGMYVNFVNMLLEDYGSIIERIKGKSISSKNGRVDLGCIYDKKGMTAPKLLSNGMYLETNLSAKDITDKIKCFLDLCSIDYKNLNIYYKENTSNVKINLNNQKKQTKDNKEKNEWLRNEKELTKTTYISINEWTRDIEFQSDKKNYENLKLYYNILAENYRKGFRYDSRIEMRKFRAYWEEKYDEKLYECDEKIYGNIDEIAISYQNRNQKFALLPEILLSEENKRELFSYIENLFSEGKQAIYYKALYEEMRTVLCESGINNPDMLKTYLSHVNEGQYHIEKSYITQEMGMKIDALEEIRNYLVQIRMPVKIDDICEDLSHIPRKKVESILYANSEFVRNARGIYFHPDSVEITEDEIIGISNIINQEILDNYFISGIELIEAIKIKYPQVLERQTQFSKLGMRDAIGYKLRYNYSFRGKIISEKGKELSMSDIYARYCQKKQHFTLNDLKALKEVLNSGIIYFEIVYGNALRISKCEFVAKNLANFDIKGTDKAIDRFCNGDYVAIKDIGHFGSFPDAGFSWNSYLLEHYVADYSQKYKLVHTNFNEGSCVGAIIKRTADIEDFYALVVDVIAKSKSDLDIDGALNYLRDCGFLARRSYKDIEQALVQAKMIRGKRG